MVTDSLETDEAPRRSRRERHGLCGTPTYRSWVAMKARCNNPNTKSYKDYGGRGIKVCDRWANSFVAFLEDMGERPEGETLDRIDLNGDYEPGNCRWLPRANQTRNTRRNKRITFRQETKTISEWAAEFGINPINLNRRLRRGWSVEEALTTPFRELGQRARLNDRQKAILAVLEFGPRHFKFIAESLGIDEVAASQSAAVLLRMGILRKPSLGVYELNEDQETVMPLTREDKK